ncbi:MAG TPA: ribokinase [Propionibacteriaceae bacterium]|nr:ribokinase [Propionibacteriaceae bacterium]
MAGAGGVAVVGSINVDLTAFVSRPPRPGETVVGERFSMVLGGKGANQALAAARAGAPTRMIGAVGQDPFAELARTGLAEAGVDTTAVLAVDGPTGVAHIRVNTATAENDIVLLGNANDRLGADEVERALRAVRARVSVVLMQLESPVAVLQRVAALSPELGLLLILDPAPAPASPLPEDIWAGVRLTKPNQHEASAITGTSVRDAASAAEAGRWFLDRGVETAVITLGERGAVVVEADGVTELPAYPVEPVDTTAAGDAFTGTLGAALSRGSELPEALRRGMAAAALAVTVRGASPSLPTAAAVEEFLSRSAP